jgi:hypothetical protein
MNTGTNVCIMLSPGPVSAGEDPSAACGAAGFLRIPRIEPPRLGAAETTTERKRPAAASFGLLLSALCGFNLE